MGAPWRRRATAGQGAGGSPDRHRSLPGRLGRPARGRGAAAELCPRTGARRLERRRHDPYRHARHRVQARRRQVDRHHRWWPQRDRRSGGDVHQCLRRRPAARPETLHHRRQYLPGGHHALAGAVARGHLSGRPRHVRYPQPAAVFPSRSPGAAADGRARSLPRTQGAAGLGPPGAGDGEDVPAGGGHAVRVPLVRPRGHHPRLPAAPARAAARSVGGSCRPAWAAPWRNTWSAAMPRRCRCRCRR